MSQETVQPTVIETDGLTPDQQQHAVDLRSRVICTQEQLGRATRQQEHTAKLEEDYANGQGEIKVPFARVVGEAGVKGLIHLRAGRAVKAARRHYEKNATAYQEQAEIEAAKDGAEINR